MIFFLFTETYITTAITSVATTARKIFKILNRYVSWVFRWLALVVQYYNFPLFRHIKTVPCGKKHNK
ncbi:hypothetical protein A4H97_19920 [Niastella yeongjuensis]|uniref:Uncharacterized protein n=1 Tax=Niastella yeongjuensis TaxID=354355 RepID=A0A1V9FBW4_9BACT|nr:hypothetical protein A4H97_19920 [Niastella yeongjuensis]